jgi:hypothetical protein
MNREEAIDWLRLKGVNAWKRDWSVGESIGIRAGQPVEWRGGTVGYENVFYLYPGPKGSWIFLDCDARCRKPIVDLPSYPDLESALQAVLDALKHQCSGEV